MEIKPALLFLCHRIPYPPNKGDKIRSFHWLQGLASKFDVYLAAFYDDPDDEQYIARLDEYCADICIKRLSPLKSKIKSVAGFATGDALSLPYYFDRSLSDWISKISTGHNIKKALVYSSSMAQYIDSKQYADVHRVIDFVDMDSDKWMQYAEKKSGVGRFIYKREGQKLQSYETLIAKQFDYSFFVSQSEVDLFVHKTAVNKNKAGFINNGVNAEYFVQNQDYDTPYPEHGKYIVFTGAMDYWANVDAVIWFSEEVLPGLRDKIPEIRFAIVGSKPTPEVSALACDYITVTGRVEDVRPYIQFADISVAPMRIARGIQNKVLEALSMGKIVVASKQGFEGIEAEPGRDLLIASDAGEFISQICNTLQGNINHEMGMYARKLVIDKYSWQSNVSKLMAILE